MKHFSVSRKMTASYLWEPPFKREYKHYQVLDGESLLGDFYYLSEHRSWECFFSYGDKQIRLKSLRRFLRSAKVWLIDEKSGEKIGQFSFPFGLIKKPISKLIVGEDCYELKSLPIGPFFKKSTWNRFKFSLARGEEQSFMILKLSLRGDFNLVPIGTWKGQSNLTVLICSSYLRVFI